MGKQGGESGKKHYPGDGGNGERRQPPAAVPSVLGPSMLRDDFFDDLLGDGFLLIAETGQQRIVTQDVDDAGDPCGLPDDGLQRARRENDAAVGRGLGQPVLNIGVTLGFGEGLDSAPDRNPLPELSQFMQIEEPVEFGLPDQYDLEQLVFGSLEIGEHAQVLEGFHRHVLSLIDDQDHVPVVLILFNEEMMETIHHLERVVAGNGHPEFLENQPEQSAERDRGVEDIDDPVLFVTGFFEVGSKDGGLPDAHFPGDGKKAFPVFNAVDDRSESLSMTRTEEEELRVRRDVERFLIEMIKAAIHGLWVMGYGLWVSINP